LTQIPPGVLCVQINVARTGTTSSFNMMAGQSSAALALGTIPAGTTTIGAAAFNLACGSVTGSTNADWVGAPVSVTVKPGINPQVNITLVPNVGSTVGVSFVNPAIALAAGEGFTLAIGTTGSLRGWGGNSTGVLGDGTLTNRLAPVASTQLGTFSSVAAGQAHVCAVSSAGGLSCWGSNFWGQLGDGTFTNRVPPSVTQPFTSGIKQVDLGNSHTCVIKTDNTVWCAGYNGDGELGNGTTTTSTTFVIATNGVDQVSAGPLLTCARSIVGQIVCWGLNSNGQVGNGTAGGNVTTPSTIGNFFGVAEVSAGYAHACARRFDGTVWCWGANNAGQVGDGTTVDRSSPVQVVGINSAVQIAAGVAHSCAHLQDATIRCWGLNQSGQLGNGSGTNALTPAFVLNLTGPTDLVAGSYHTCARLDSGNVACWGDNGAGEIGDGTTSNRFVPTNPAW
jgi:alpha-tubulin suppressor-like RCC1 family protein